jgi:hemerythrin
MQMASNRLMINNAGDEVLRELSRCLRYSVRSDDVVCRLIGDEFLILCPNTLLRGAI